MNESQTVQKLFKIMSLSIMGQRETRKSFDLLDQLLSHRSIDLPIGVSLQRNQLSTFLRYHELAAIRMEDPAVFLSSHELILQLLKNGAPPDCVSIMLMDCTTLAPTLGIQRGPKTPLLLPQGRPSDRFFLSSKKSSRRKRPCLFNGRLWYDRVRFLTWSMGCLWTAHMNSFQSALCPFYRITFPLKTVLMKVALIMRASMSSRSTCLGISLIISRK